MQEFDIVKNSKNKTTKTPRHKVQSGNHRWRTTGCSTHCSLLCCFLIEILHFFKMYNADCPHTNIYQTLYVAFNKSYWLILFFISLKVNLQAFQKIPVHYYIVPSRSDREAISVKTVISHYCWGVGLRVMPKTIHFSEERA